MAVAHYLSTFWPLCITAAGRRASNQFGHPPFVDASCRREPDFESAFPSITTICHADKFAPRLHEGDRVIFMTRKGRYLDDAHSRWRLVAALEVAHRFDDHRQAAEWYRAKALPLPSNCMVKGSEPLPLDHTAQPTKNLCQWDLGYWKRARANGTFLACNKLYLELSAPPPVEEADLIRIFGRVPVTRNPPRISSDDFNALLALAR